MRSTTGEPAHSGSSAVPGTRHVVVIGGGISGLAAAEALCREGGPGVRVTVLEGSPRVGGKLSAVEIAGVPVDEGAESMLARRPEGADLARSVGLGAELQPPATASATLWTRGALRPMPRGHVMGVPGDLTSLAASGVLSAAGLARLPMDHALAPHPYEDDVTVGKFVAARLGHEVVDRLVEPLLGGVYAGDAYAISLAAAVPQLVPVARGGGSLLAGVRELVDRAPDPATAGPVFTGIAGGIGRLPLATAEAVEASGRGTVRTRATVRALNRTPDGWQVVVGDTRSPELLDADAVVVAVPAAPAARLLAPHSHVAAVELGSIEYAGMAIVTMAFRRADLAHALPGSGFLVPPVDGRRIKASTFASNKWGWIDQAGPDTFVLRTSLGRAGEEAVLQRDDADLVADSLADLHDAVGIAAAPLETRVTRWGGGLPQYAIGHLGRVACVEDAVERLPGLEVCGAAYHGVGIPACIASGRRAAAGVLAALSDAARDTRPGVRVRGAEEGQSVHD
ncbi:protoporphyrinogen oxidase [Yinghuangia soli]|uniref:Coproporphyrinogen III oxidase n=1 Tax=Yinghuangia soli TaxID=2908204 RepID=A0AA41TWW8_9ACTN|nr:protoporphyrinogen oxidase [Yinghuangia soli]MCF2526258.1 protoporphyrinogen oxidase [Yinghuangia soli]